MIKLQPATLCEPFDFISLYDDALDTEADDFAEKYAQFNDGTGPAPLRDGHQPTVWKLQPIADAQLQGMLEGYREEHGRTMWFIATALVGIIGVANAPKELGKLRRPRSPDGYPTLAKDQQDLLGGHLLSEIGIRIITAGNTNPA